MSPGFGTIFIIDYTAPKRTASSERLDNLFCSRSLLQSDGKPGQTPRFSLSRVYSETLIVTVLVPSYGLLTQKSPSASFFFWVTSLLFDMRYCWRKSAASKAFSEHVRMKRVWLHRENFRRQNIISWSGNCQDNGWDLYTKYNEYCWGISLTANRQELHLLSHVKMHYLSLVLCSYVNKLRPENITIASLVLYCKIAQQ